MDEKSQSDPMNMLISESAARLRADGEDREAIIATIRGFLDAGMAIVYSPSAMWDHFGTVLRRAGFNEQERDRRMRIFSTVTQEVFMDGQPYPPDWRWHEHDGAEAIYEWRISDLAELKYGPDGKKWFPQVAISTDEQLQTELQRLARLEPRCVEIALPEGDYINLCIGGPLAAFEYSRAKNVKSPLPSGDAVAKSPPEGTVYGFLCEGTHSEMLAKYLLPVNDVIEIAVYFFRTRSLPDWVVLR
jgi:hypothetical protein